MELISILGSTIRTAVPLVFASLGGIYSERSGVVNIALEGMMLAGAFTAAAVTAKLHNPWLGVLAAALAGILVALVHAVACINLKANQVVIGTAINIMFVAVPGLLSGALFDSTGSTPQLAREETLATPLVYAAFLAVPLSWYLLFKTPFGLRLRASGEKPEAADTAGVSVTAMRYYGVLASGLLAGLGGAYLSIGQNSLFTRNMTAGRGFIALAAVILGNWHPLKTLAACLLFGFAEAVSIRMQGVSSIPNQFIQIIPYVLTMVVLSGFVGRVSPPKALGQPYIKERR
ncbi:MAG: ABC transporter permease [Acidobacteriota bacterium]|nr:ABC transporter permease [Blastocatellia bacterium]MDW8412224.1 ABC transporter permease [Acidobacteriota bacterium]